MFKIIKEIHDLNIKWTEEEILGAWKKSRSAKSDKCSLQSREKVKLLKINQMLKSIITSSDIHSV